MNKVDIEFKRGMVFYVNLNDKAVGSEQCGRRPCVIIQNDIGNKYSPTVIVSVITSRVGKRRLPTQVALDKSRNSFLACDSMITTEQIKTVDKKRIADFLGYISKEDEDSLNKALVVSVGLQEDRYMREEVRKVKYYSSEITKIDNLIELWLKANNDISAIGNYIKERERMIIRLESYCKTNGMDYKEYYTPYQNTNEEVRGDYNNIRMVG